MRTLIESVIRSRMGRYTLRVYDRRPAVVLPGGAADGISASGSGEPRALPVAGDVVIRWGDIKHEYGLGVLPSYVEVSFLDRSGWLRSVFDNAYTPEAAAYVRLIETLFPASIEGPDGRGGRFTWHGIVARGTRQRALARRLGPGTTSIYLYDGLAALSDMPPLYAGYSLGEWLTTALAEVNPLAGDMCAHHDLIGRTGAGEELDLLASFDRLHIPPEADVSTRREQLDYICAQLGTRCFFDPERGAFVMMHRASIGERTEVVRLTPPTPEIGGSGAGGTSAGSSGAGTYSAEAYTLPARTETVEPNALQAGGRHQGELQDLEEAGIVEITLPDEYNLVRDPHFRQVDIQDATSFVYWDTSGASNTIGSREGIALGGTGSIGTARQEVATLVPAEARTAAGQGLRAIMTWSAEENGNDPSLTVRLTTVEERAAGAVTKSVSLSTDDSVGLDPITDASDAALVSDVFKKATRIEVEMSGDKVRITNVRLRLLEPIGDKVITTLFVSASGLSIRPVRVEGVEGLHVTNEEVIAPFGTENIGPLIGYTSRRYSSSAYEGVGGRDTYELGFLYAAADRARARTSGVETLRARALPGLLGPRTRLMITKPEDSGRYASGTPTAFIVGGGRSINLSDGTTEIADCQLPSSIL